MEWEDRDGADTYRCRGSLNTPPFKCFNLPINLFNCSPPPAVDPHSSTPAWEDTPFLANPQKIPNEEPPTPPAEGQSTPCPAPFHQEIGCAANPKPSAAAPKSLASEAAAAPSPVSPHEDPHSETPTPSAAGKSSPASEAVAAPCPASPHAEPGTSVDPLLALAMATAVAITHAPCLDTFLRGKQQPTLSAPPAGTPHPATGLLQEYAKQGCPAEVGDPWPIETIKQAISTGPHASTLKPAATSFC